LLASPHSSVPGGAVLLILFTFLLSLDSHAAIFGVDERFSILPTHKQHELARATAVGVLSSMIEATKGDPSTYTLTTSNLSDMLCSDQKFYKMPSVDYACSAFLIAPDILVTAGHCSVNVGETKNETEMYCDSYGWLFDYQVQADGTVRKEKIPADNYYQCKEIIYAINDKKNGITYDYAVIRLDRTVVGRTPLTLSDISVSIGERVSMIGYPMGAPVTYAQNATITALNPIGDSYITTLDAFDGNSGSAVLNSKNEVVGLLIAGTPESFISKPNLGSGVCYTYNTCDINGKNCTSEEGILDSIIPIGSEVQSIAPVREILQSL
jgi:V8-like Glu-specific endopeptidase